MGAEDYRKESDHAGISAAARAGMVSASVCDDGAVAAVSFKPEQF